MYFKFLESIIHVLLSVLGNNAFLAFYEWNYLNFFWNGLRLLWKDLTMKYVTAERPDRRKF